MVVVEVGTSLLTGKWELRKIKDRIFRSSQHCFGPGLDHLSLAMTLYQPSVCYPGLGLILGFGHALHSGTH